MVSYGYDNANRLISLQNTAAAGVIASYSHTLDNNGNRTATDETVPTTMNAVAMDIGFGYNAKGTRLLTAGANSFNYDNEGQINSGYSHSFTFDYEHRLSTIGTDYQFFYDGAGNRLMATRYGVTTKYVYDAKGNLLAEADGNNNITKYYIYGAGLLEMVNSSGAYCYHFDSTGHTVALTDQNQNIVNAYAYDPFGNQVGQQETVPQGVKKKN